MILMVNKGCFIDYGERVRQAINSILSTCLNLPRLQHLCIFIPIVKGISMYIYTHISFSFHRLPGNSSRTIRSPVRTRPPRSFRSGPHNTFPHPALPSSPPLTSIPPYHPCLAGRPPLSLRRASLRNKPPADSRNTVDWSLPRHTTIDRSGRVSSDVPRG